MVSRGRQKSQANDLKLLKNWAKEVGIDLPGKDATCGKAGQVGDLCWWRGLATGNTPPAGNGRRSSALWRGWNSKQVRNRATEARQYVVAGQLVT
jgi:hypothetical protein